jgi:hypothetical protein
MLRPTHRKNKTYMVDLNVKFTLSGSDLVLIASEMLFLEKSLTKASLKRYAAFALYQEGIEHRWTIANRVSRGSEEFFDPDNYIKPALDFVRQAYGNMNFDDIEEIIKNNEDWVKTHEED